VQSFPEPALRTQIASNGPYPGWRQDGREIIYYGDDDTIWSIRVDRSGAELHFNVPERLFTVPRSANFSAPLNPLAISGDGSRIFLIEDIPQTESNVIHVAMGLVR
jgi:hypothetical protein